MLTKLHIDLLLAALSALLPLVPDKHRARAGDVLHVVSDVTNAAASIGDHAADLAAKLAALRAEVDAMGAVSASDMDQALTRVREASAAFRAALETAAASPT
jgi:hypothetical protein